MNHLSLQALAVLGFDLLRPVHASWLVGALGFALLGAWSLRARRRQRELLVADRHQARFLPHFAPSVAVARVALASLALVFLGIAVTGPVRGYTERSVARKGLDLVVCIDTSRSMLVRDLRPDRLTRAKREVAGLIDQMQGDRIALVAFAGEARDVSPLTHDRTTLKALLERVSPDENTKGGTDLGQALQHALEMFDGQAAAHEAIVMLTDGEDLEGHGLEVARTAAERGIRVYIVGMATEAGGKIPQVASDGRESFVTDEEGRDVISTLGAESLDAIAKETEGEFLAATRSPLPLEDLYKRRINRLEGRELMGSIEYVPHDRFQWFLCLAVACMLVEVALRERRLAPRVGGAA